MSTPRFPRLRAFSFRRSATLIHSLLGLFFASQAAAQVNLFEQVGVPNFVALPAHAIAAQPVRINRRALAAPSVSIDLFGEPVTALRERVERQTAGQTVWIGHLQGNPADTVIVTARGNVFSGLIQRGADMYRITAGVTAQNRLLQLELAVLPPDDADSLPQGGSAAEDPPPAESQANTVQDLLVVYTQGACNAAGGCAQLEADIATAVADINTAYAASGVDITMNLAGTAQTVYAGTNASQALADLRGTSDGQMDEVHPLRDQLGADVVSLIYDGQGCGIGYLNSSAAYAFNVTDEPCLVGNRTMAHEIGHNQGAHHDRQTVGGGSVGAYNYGYRRCNDGSVDDFGSPYFRTVLSYSCASAPRVGRFSNPGVNYSGVPQGVDPAVDPAKGAFNARTLNESAGYVASFRTAPASMPPDAPSGLVATATASDAIALDWLDNSDNENSFVLQSSTDQASWSTIATLAANTTFHTDDGLSPETTYYYRVRADNGAGSSAYSNTASDTTLPLPASVEDVANGEVSISGSVNGSYAATQAAGGAVQTITETHSGGPRNRRKQSYEHAWTFDVFGGAGGVVASVDAWVSGSEGANFYYSLDGGTTRNLMFTVDNNAQGSPQMFVLPGGTDGPVRIEVQDAAQTQGEAVDSVTVDHLVITSYTVPGDPPLAPSFMTVGGASSNSVSMDFTDNSEDEFGFEIWRAMADPGTDCNAGAVHDTVGAMVGTGLVTYVDTAATPGTTYWYWAKSFNGGGDNGQCSNVDSGTTSAATAITLTVVDTYKFKGVKHADLSWTGTGAAAVDIYRDAALVATVPDTGAHSDNTGMKGGSAHVYRVCEAGSSVVCSDEVTATF